MSITISHSDIANFLACLRRFDLSYVQDFKQPEKLFGPLACGSRVHLALDTYHRTGKSPVEAHQELVVQDEEKMAASGAPDWAMTEFYKDVVMGRNCCLAYVEWVEREGPYDGFTIESETHLEAPILDGRVILRGKADLLLTREADDVTFTDDFKTSSPHVRTTLPVLLEKSYQHIVYQVLTQLVRPDIHVAGAYYTILFKSTLPARMLHPMVERFHVPAAASSVPRRMAQIEEIASEMLRLMERREELGSVVAYPMPQDSCRWCEFKHPCQMLDENPLGARAMLDNEFQRGGRHARYDT